MAAIIVLLSLFIPIGEVLLFSVVIQYGGIWAAIVPSAVSFVAGAAILFKSLPRFLDRSLNHQKTSTFPTMASYFEVTRIVSGFLLLVPGFISDVIGLVLLHPRMRGLSFVILARLAARSRDGVIPVDRSLLDKAPESGNDNTADKP